MRKNLQITLLKGLTEDIINKVKIAINTSPLELGHKVRGIGIYTRELIKAIKALESKDIFIFDLNFKEIDLSKFDVVHYPYFHPFFLTLPIKKPAKVVLTIHDLIQLIYPKQYQPGIKGSVNFFIQKFLAKKVDHIIVPSETTKKDVIRFLGVPHEKITVIFEAPRSIFRQLPSSSKKLNEVRKKYKLPIKFALYVGDVNYNKNVLLLIRACKLTNLELVICGKQAREIEDGGVNLKTLSGPRDILRFLFNIPHPELTHLENLTSEFRNNAKVHRLGFVPDEDLAAIYNDAFVYIQPSFYEGFGLPVLEAMECGTPVIVSRTNALVEIADGAALVADPNNPNDLAQKISTLLKDAPQRAALVKEGKKRISAFSWKKAGEQTVEVYRKVLSAQ